MTGKKPRRSVTDRARRRAIRARASALGVPYSVSARLLMTQPAGDPAGHRAWLFAMRERRPYLSRLRDTRLAADLPLGRATHLAERFPQPVPGCGAVLAMLYAVLGQDSPAIAPTAEQLAWVAELGEETAVDFVCADLDRAARQLLDQDPWHLCTRIDAVIVAGLAATDRSLRDVAKVLSPEFRTMIPRRSFEAARNLLDELLTAAAGLSH